MGYATDIQNSGKKRPKKSTFNEDEFGVTEGSGFIFTKLRKFNKKHYMYHTSARKELSLNEDKKELNEKGYKYRTVKGKLHGKPIYRLYAGRLEDLEFFTMNNNKYLKEAINETKARKKTI